MAALPDGDAAPLDGSLPVAALTELQQRPFGIYLHVPFCASRCGYCDFTTYAPGELTGGETTTAYVEAALAELALARRVLGDAAPQASTVFVGGGTPTLLPRGDLEQLLAAVEATFGLAPDVEVTTEANPESVDPAAFASLRAAGFTRVSLGMQSAMPHVLKILDRRHRVGRPQEAAAEARAAGFDHVNLDLIYGAPGETDDDWRASLAAALSAPVDHVSAYALVVEDGTAMARQVRRGELAVPDDDVLADRWLIADETLTAAGFGSYEVSNWARDASAECRHNQLYWQGGNWWGIGPGAHSHVGGVRWWNVKRPAAYAGRLAAGESPGAARETVDAQARALERVLLEVRVREGVPVAVVPNPGALPALAADGLIESSYGDSGRVVLTRRGRLLADAVTRAIT